MPAAPMNEDNLNQLPTSSSQQLYFAVQRPWSELFSNSSSYSFPTSSGEFTSRIRRNLSYFLLNYVDIVWMIILVSSFWHPESMIAILCLVFRCMYLRRNHDQTVVMNRSVNNRRLLLLVALCILIAVVLALAGTWLYAVVGLGIVVLHATFRISENLFLDIEQEEAAEEGGLVYVVDIKDDPSPESPLLL